MVRKVTTFICVLAIVLCFSIPTQAASFDLGDYDLGIMADGDIFHYPIDSKVKTWAETHINALPIGTDYIFMRHYLEEYGLENFHIIVSNSFRIEEGEYSYLSYILSDDAIVYNYTITHEGYETSVETNYYIGTICIGTYGDDLVSSLNGYPDLIERSYYAEILNTILLCVLLLSFVLSAFFRSR